MNEIVDVIHDEKRGRFFVAVNGQEEGKMTFVYAGPDTIIIDHTEVNPGNEGKNFGKKMFLKAIDFAREESLKIIPLCPFAKKMFDKMPEVHDVLK